MGVGIYEGEKEEVMDVSDYKGYSVLMSVYHKEKPEYLKQAIASIQAQTLPTDDFVLVCDGPLNDALDVVIAKKQQEMGKTLNVVRLAKNGGLGNALNEGIKHCKNELVARMDSDDIAYPDRCEKQIAVFYTHLEVSICSGIVEEFTSTPDVVDAKRVPLKEHGLSDGDYKWYIQLKEKYPMQTSGFGMGVESEGYEAYRVDDDKISNSIIAKIFKAAQTCPMAVCDLSDQNPNVLYELGLRQKYELSVNSVKKFRYRKSL